MEDSALVLTRDEDFLYLQIADRLGSQIRQQVLKTGEKLPSVRALSTEQGISISTAYKAYVHVFRIPVGAVWGWWGYGGPETGT